MSETGIGVGDSTDVGVREARETWLGHCAGCPRCVHLPGKPGEMRLCAEGARLRRTLLEEVTRLRVEWSLAG